MQFQKPAQLVGVVYDRPAWDYRPPPPPVLVVPPSLFADMQRLGFMGGHEPVYENRPYFSTTAPTPLSWDNLSTAPPLTRDSFRGSVRRLLSLPSLLASLREEIVERSIWQLRGPRRHPRSAILWALGSTSCQLDEIIEVLGRKRRTVEKWMQQLQRAGIVGYRRSVGYYLRAVEPTP